MAALGCTVTNGTWRGHLTIVPLQQGAAQQEVARVHARVLQRAEPPELHAVTEHEPLARQLVLKGAD